MPSSHLNSLPSTATDWNDLCTRAEGFVEDCDRHVGIAGLPIYSHSVREYSEFRRKERPKKPPRSRATTPNPLGYGSALG